MHFLTATISSLDPRAVHAWAAKPADMVFDPAIALVVALTGNDSQARLARESLRNAFCRHHQDLIAAHAERKQREAV
jgi:hypothetical protein